MVEYVFILITVVLLIWASYHDIKTHEINNFVPIIISSISMFLYNTTITDRLLGAFFCFIIPFAINIASHNGFGMGDVKLLASFGFVFGVFGGLLCTLIGLSFTILLTTLSSFSKKAPKTIPLAPLLSIAFFAVLLLF